MPYPTTTPVQTLPPQPAPSQNEINEDFTRRFSELSTDIDQLRLQVQHGIDTPSSSSTTSTIGPTVPPPSRPKSFFFYETAGRERLPSLHNTNEITSVYIFLTKLEREFRLRNYELQLPADNTKGWARYALSRLGGSVETQALYKWGVSTDISWETFREWVMKTFYNEKVIRDINREYTALTYSNYGDITTFNTRFRELRLLMSFVGKDTTEDSAITDYQAKITGNPKVALALGQFLAVDRICERDPKVTLEEIMDYCDTIHHT